MPLSLLQLLADRLIVNFAVLHDDLAIDFEVANAGAAVVGPVPVIDLVADVPQDVGVGGNRTGGESGTFDIPVVGILKVELDVLDDCLDEILVHFLYSLLQGAGRPCLTNVIIAYIIIYARRTLHNFAISNLFSLHILLYMQF